MTGFIELLVTRVLLGSNITIFKDQQKMLVTLSCFIVLVRSCKAMSGLAETVLSDTKFVCPSKEQKSFKVSSEMQCVQRCLHVHNCGIINYKLQSDGRNDERNCEVFAVDNGKCYGKSYVKNWKAMVFKREKKDYESCSEIFKDKNQRTDRNGLYHLKSGKHYCIMDDVAGCGTGGWTLAMKVNGTMLTFKSDSEYWKNTATYNVKNGLKSFENEEAKFPAFSSASFKSICFGIRFAGKSKWIRLAVNSESLLKIFQTETTKSTNFGRNKWKSLISDASLQHNCNREGINVKDGHNKLFVRIGILNNQENDCNTPDSFIGVGTIDKVLCSSSYPSISCGNVATCSPDNGNKFSAAMCYILIQ